MSTATRQWPRRSPRWGSAPARAVSCWRPRAASDVPLLDALPFGMGIALAALVGLILGSFIATLVLRWPAGRSVLGRSQCDACGRPLGLLDLVPLLSALAARGGCRMCGEIGRASGGERVCQDG